MKQKQLTLPTTQLRLALAHRGGGEMSELVKIIGAMAERGWVYSSPFNTYDSLTFTHTDGEIRQFKSWDEVAKFVEGVK